MYWVTVEGRTLPKLVGGDPALDLCNTYAGWGGPPLPRAEWLRDAEAVIVWCMHAGLLEHEAMVELRQEARARPAVARCRLERVRLLRADLYTTLVGGEQASDDEAFDRLAELAQRAARASRFVRGDGGGARWVLPPDLKLDLPVLRLAERAADLLTDPRRDQVRVCPGDECGWLFLDRRGTRRWCSMQTCGNRAKAKMFATRNKRS